MLCISFARGAGGWLRISWPSAPSPPLPHCHVPSDHIRLPLLSWWSRRHIDGNAVWRVRAQEGQSSGCSLFWPCLTQLGMCKYWCSRRPQTNNEPMSLHSMKTLLAVLIIMITKVKWHPISIFCVSLSSLSVISCETWCIIHTGDNNRVILFSWQLLWFDPVLFYLFILLPPASISPVWQIDGTFPRIC